jgi:hypothetical protein
MDTQEQDQSVEGRKPFDLRRALEEEYYKATGEMPTAFQLSRLVAEECGWGE